MINVDLKNFYTNSQINLFIIINEYKFNIFNNNYRL